MLEQILQSADLYAQGVKEVQDKRDSWQKKYKEVKDRLIEVASYLNAHAAYKQGFFVDVLHAFDEDMNGTSASMPSIAFRSGEMPMLVTFKNSMGEKKGYMEQGFHISFNPTITGQVIAILTPHASDLNKREPQYATLAIIDDPAQLTNDITDQIIAKGIEAAFYTSFTGISKHREPEDNEPQVPVAHSPIGFKLHDTTEKVQ